MVSDLDLNSEYSSTDLLKHDKVLSKKEPPAHLREVPEYLLDPTTQEARKIVKIARAAMGHRNPGPHPGSKRKSRRKRDPLKTLSAEVPFPSFYQICLNKIKTKCLAVD